MTLRDRIEMILGYGVLLIIIVAVVGISFGFMWYTSSIDPVFAAPATKYQEPGCEKLGTVGTVEIDRCTDGVNVWLANSAGMISSASK